MMRVALIHDHLAQNGGAERVVRVLQKMFPQAPLYVLVYNPTKAHQDFKGTDIRTSFIQRLPGGLRYYQWYLNLMPTAVERYDLRDYDLVISNSASFAKGVITSPQTLHLSYIHSPTRFLWSDTISYVDDLHYPRFLRRVAPLMLSSVRQWDRMAADRPDMMLANSENVRRRIWKYYRRPSKVLYPPTDTARFSIADTIGNYYLTGGRLVNYKRFDIAVEAFNKLGLPLKIFGTGPAEKMLRQIAKKNIEFLGNVADHQLNDLYGRAIAFINPQEEDFGLTAIETMATGRPVIAYAAGGALETIKSKQTGVLFADQGWESLADAVIRFRPEQYSSREIKQWAESFSLPAFQARLNGIIDDAWQQHQNGVGYHY